MGALVHSPSWCWDPVCLDLCRPSACSLSLCDDSGWHCFLGFIHSLRLLTVFLLPLLPQKETKYWVRDGSLCPFPSQCWVRPVQAVCMIPQSLWIHMYVSPVVSRRPCFLGVFQSLLALTMFLSTSLPRSSQSPKRKDSRWKHPVQDSLSTPCPLVVSVFATIYGIISFSDNDWVAIAECCYQSFYGYIFLAVVFVFPIDPWSI